MGGNPVTHEKKGRFPIYGNALFVCCKYFLFTDVCRNGFQATCAEQQHRAPECF